MNQQTVDTASISSNNEGSGKCPDREVLEWLDTQDIPTYWTGIHGDVTFIIEEDDDEDVEPEPFENPTMKGVAAGELVDEFIDRDGDCTGGSENKQTNPTDSPDDRRPPPIKLTPSPTTLG